MTNQQLYIDGILMDLGEDFSVTLDIKSNLFRDITKVTANNTYTIQLPKTTHNMTSIDWSAKPKSGSRYPFAFHKARYFRNGLELIKDGKATLLSVGDNIEIAIYWGLFPAFSSLLEDDLKLNELNTPKHIQFKKRNSIDTYDKALVEGVFYADYDTAQFKSSSDDWQGGDSVEGGNQTETYGLISGKIKTGTTVGAHIDGTIEEDSEFRCAIIRFKVGMTATIERVVGRGDYRVYAVTDYNMNVVELAADNSGKEYETMPNLPDIDPNIPIGVSAGWLIANNDTLAMNVTTIRIRLSSSAPSGTIEYGTFDPETNKTEVWGTANVSAGASGVMTVNVTKFKEEGLLIYLRPSVDGLLFCVLGIGGTHSYIVDSDGVSTSSNSCIYSVKYTSEDQPVSLKVSAPSTAAWLIVNTITKYNTSTQMTVKTITEAKAKAQAEFGNGGFGSDYLVSQGPVQPSVACKWLLDLITQQTGVGFSWSELSAEYINELAIPLVTRTADEQTLEGSVEGSFYDTSELGMLDFLFNETSSVFAEHEVGHRYTQLSVSIACTMTFDIQMYWSWDASTATPQGHRSFSFNGSDVTEAFYTYPPNYIEMKIVSQHTNDQDESEYTNTYIVGVQYQGTITDNESSKVNGKFIHLANGRGAIDLEEGDVITFEMKNYSGGTLRGLKCYNGTIKATLKEDDEVPYGGMFPIGKNLPDIKVTDFLKFLSFITGTFPAQSFVGGCIRFVDIAALWGRREDAVDWTRKLIAKNGNNLPRNTEYSIGDYRRHNLYKWKEDDTVYDEHDGDLQIDNPTLEYTQDAWTFPFAASDGNKVPIYEWEDATRDFATHSITIQKATKYKACKDRIMNLVKTEAGLASLRFNIKLQDIFDTKYSMLSKTLSKAHVIKEWLYLSDLELLNFDETNPVYLAQYGAYFAVTELKTTGSGYTEATMLQLEF